MNDEAYLREFWGKRQHLIVGSLVRAGAFPDVDPDAYDQELHRLVDQGRSPYFACNDALEAARNTRTVSACEANPW